MKTVCHFYASLPMWSRRRFLARNALGLGSVALAWLLREENLLATPPNIPRGPQSFDLKPKGAAAPSACSRHDLAFHAWRAKPCRFVRSQTRTDPAQR